MVAIEQHKKKLNEYNTTYDLRPVQHQLNRGICTCIYFAIILVVVVADAVTVGSILFCQLKHQDSKCCNNIKNF